MEVISRFGGMSLDLFFMITISQSVVNVNCVPFNISVHQMTLNSRHYKYAFLPLISVQVTKCGHASDSKLRSALFDYRSHNDNPNSRSFMRMPG
jgi:hypothetical protein